MATENFAILLKKRLLIHCCLIGLNFLMVTFMANGIIKYGIDQFQHTKNLMSTTMINLYLTLSIIWMNFCDESGEIRPESGKIVFAIRNANNIFWYIVLCHISRIITCVFFTHYFNSISANDEILELHPLTYIICIYTILVTICNIGTYARKQNDIKSILLCYLAHSVLWLYFVEKTDYKYEVEEKITSSKGQILFNTQILVNILILYIIGSKLNEIYRSYYLIEDEQNPNNANIINDNLQASSENNKGANKKNMEHID